MQFHILEWVMFFEIFNEEQQSHDKVMTVKLLINCGFLCGIIQNVLCITTADRIEYWGFTSEIHNVTTGGGFTFSIFRIKPSASHQSQGARPVVLLMHGLSSSSDYWVLKGLHQPLAFQLANNGYDVWLGNTRGNPYGYDHPKISMNSREFWRFSWHEIGVEDLPSTIDYILDITQQRTLHYVGHSQGCTSMFVLLSEMPEYNEKLRSVHLLAPVAYANHSRSTLVRTTAIVLGRYSILDPLIGDSQLFQNPILQKLSGFESCRRTGGALKICPLLYFLAFGGVSDYTLKSVYPDFFETHPARCSTHQAIHFLQLYVSGYFRQYDFGHRGNRLRYGQDVPPEYDLSKINPRSPLHLYHSKGDTFSAIEDVERLSAVLGNRSIRHYIDLDRFAHMDFVLAYNAHEVVNPNILRVMQQMDANFSE
uniref:Lipase n=1 Tax=Musca domestica TaxID=7370 RepID=A0A1I8MC97_MUSDO